MVELSDKDFNAAAVKGLQCSIIDILETNEETENLIRDTSFKNYRTEKYNNK